MRLDWASADLSTILADCNTGVGSSVAGMPALPGPSPLVLIRIGILSLSGFSRKQ
jgi:hypothetical protein